MTHRFNLILSGIAELTPDLSDTLYESTGGDIELHLKDGVACAEFERDSSSLREAILSAIQQVEMSGLGLRVLRVESETANTIAKINAQLLGA